MFDLINAHEEQQTHRDTIRREVARLNQARRARRQLKHHPFYAAALAGVGDVLVGVGSRLQDHYGELVDDVHPAREAC
jgi:hypothetical protein